jgi:hypothetical protein
MNWLHRRRSLAISLVLLFLLFTAGCSSPAQPRTDDSAPPDGRQVPFRDAENSGLDQSPAQNNVHKPESTLPFRESQGVPAGTLLTVRLKDPISADSPGASGTFDAIVDEPVVVEGNALLPRGANVAGRVESAQASRLKRYHGYVRLTLASIVIAGQELPIQTSSLFVNGSASETEAAPDDSSPRMVRVEGGRRLTFRLTEPLLIASQAEVTAR